MTTTNEPNDIDIGDDLRITRIARQAAGGSGTW